MAGSWGARCSRTCWSRRRAVTRSLLTSLPALSSYVLRSPTRLLVHLLGLVSHGLEVGFDLSGIQRRSLHRNSVIGYLFPCDPPGDRRVGNRGSVAWQWGVETFPRLRKTWLSRRGPRWSGSAHIQPFSSSSAAPTVPLVLAIRSASQRSFSASSVLEGTDHSTLESSILSMS